MDTVNILFPIKNKLSIDEAQAVSGMNSGLQRLIDLGAIKGQLNDILVDYKISNPEGYAIATIKKEALVDPSKLTTFGAGKALDYEFPVVLESPEFTQLVESYRNFSVQSLKERMKLSMRSPKIRMRYLVMDYKRFYKQQQKQIENNQDQAKSLRNMFLNDMMSMFTDLVPQLAIGKNLNSMLGMAQITPKITKASQKLSIAYTRAIKSQKSSGTISKSIMTALKSSYNEFMTVLMETIMPGLLIAGLDPEERQKIEEEAKQRQGLTEEQTEHSYDALLARTFSTSDDQKVIVDTTNAEVLKNLLEYIQKIGNGGHSFKIIVDPESLDTKEEFFWDGDGSDRINSVTAIVDKESTEEKSKRYSYCPDGRIRMFNV